MDAATSATMPVIGPGINTVVTDKTPRADVYRKHAGDNVHGGKAVIGGALIKVGAVRLQDRLPADGSSQQRHRGVG